MELQFTFSLLSFVGLFFLFITITLFNTFDRSKNLPPQPWKLPLIGHIHHLLGAQPHHALTNLAHKLGPVFSLQLGQVSAIVISSPSLAKEIMKTHDISFANRPKLLGVEIMAYNYKGTAFAPYGEYWRQMRKVCVLGLLSAKKVESFRSIREEETQNLVESIVIQMKRLESVNLSKMIFKMTNTIICRVAVGSRCKDQETLIALIREAVSLSSGFDVSDLFPSIRLLPVITGIRNKMMTIHNKVDALLDSIISIDHQERRVDGSSDVVNEDLLDVLLRLKDEGGLEFPLTSYNIKGIISEMFVAGTDTSSLTIQWAMSELMKNPRVMKKAQDELRRILKGKNLIHESDIQELDYLKLVIKETLRLHPPLPFLLPRECQEKCEIGGYHIPTNTKVIINTWKIGRDPDYWINPESFMPERFIQSSINMMGINFEFLPFGSGRRMCPGMNLGLANVELPLAILLYHFNWELPNGATPQDFDMFESCGLGLYRQNDLLLIPHPYDTNI